MWRVLAALALSLVISIRVAGQGTPPSAAATVATDRAAEIKLENKPSIPDAEWGVDVRVRSETWDNIIDFNQPTDDFREQVRFRTRAWLKLPLHQDFEFFVKIANEFRYQPSPSLDISGDEVVFENLYLDFRKVIVPGLSIRVGRQDLMRGEGFILFEGTPGDGSRTQYFNAADIAYQVRKSKVELIGILNPSQEQYLPGINRQVKYLTEWDEQAIGAYYTGRDLKTTDFDAYYFYKKEVNDSRPTTSPLYQPDRHVNTAGGRAVHRFPKSFTGTGEFALQWGAQHPSTSIRAWGGYGYVKRTFGARLAPYLLGGIWALSGDNPNTPNKVEGWDPLFSRWPKWSELYLYTLIPEKGVGYWSNDRFTQVEGGFSPWKPISVRATWYHHDAFHPHPGTPAIFSSGTVRGDDVQVYGEFVINKHLKGHLLYDAFLPGSFYAGTSSGYFLRGEMSYSFKGSFALHK